MAEIKRNRPQRTNNPLNLKVKAPIGEAIGNDEQGFCIFPFWEAGWRAGHRHIAQAMREGLNVTEFITLKQAPPTENDTQDYIDFVIEHMRCGPFTLLTELSTFALAGVMAQREGAFEKN